MDKRLHISAKNTTDLLPNERVLHAASAGGVDSPSQGARITVGIVNRIAPQNAMCKRWDTLGLWQLKLNATDIAAAADIQERTAQRCINLLDGGIYETYHLEPTRPLEHQVEADACYQSAGSKGLARE